MCVWITLVVDVGKWGHLHVHRHATTYCKCLIKNTHIYIYTKQQPKNLSTFLLKKVKQCFTINLCILKHLHNPFIRLNPHNVIHVLNHLTKHEKMPSTFTFEICDTSQRWKQFINKIICHAVSYLIHCLASPPAHQTLWWFLKCIKRKHTQSDLSPKALCSYLHYWKLKNIILQYLPMLKINGINIQHIGKTPFQKSHLYYIQNILKDPISSTPVQCIHKFDLQIINKLIFTMGWNCFL